MSREFRKMIFIGNDDYTREIIKLKSVLIKAVNILSEYHQHDLIRSKEQIQKLKEDRVHWENELKDCVCDIVAAFGYDLSEFNWKRLKI